jgi:rhodanese-related sulfurtransferase
MYRPYMDLMTLIHTRGRTCTAALGAVVGLGLLSSWGGMGSAYAFGGVGASAPGAAVRPAPTTPVAAVERLAPAAFAARMRATHGKLINVHVPDAGEIPGTDYHIPFDRIVGDTRLPKGHDTEILIYCRSGNMSAVAGKSLIDAGYTRVVELIGGFNAWQAERRPFTPPHS